MSTPISFNINGRPGQRLLEVLGGKNLLLKGVRTDDTKECIGQSAD